MKKMICLLVLVFGVCCFFSCNKKDNNEVVVYAYKSFTGEWGAGSKIAKRFEEKTGCAVRFVTTKDAGGIISRLESEKESVCADVVIGIDNYLLPKVRAKDLLVPYKPSRYDEILDKLIMSEDALLTPFDFGYFAFMYNTESDVKPPSSLKDLTLPEYKGKIVIMDPQTSTPGLGALLWMRASYQDTYIDLWKDICANVLAMPTSWSQGYALFKSGEVPLAISYTTSLAAHILYDQTDSLKPLIFEEGHICQIEGMGIVKGAPHEENAKAFLDFMLSDEAQSELAETQFMFPVMQSVELPSSFKAVPEIKKVLSVEVGDGLIEEIVEHAIESIK